MEQPHVIVIFGATGDLAKRKLLPGLLHLFKADLLKNSKIIGTSLDDLDDEQFEKMARASCEEFANDDMTGNWDDFASMLSYVPQSEGGPALKKAVEAREKELAEFGEPDRLHYLSVPPNAALQVVH